MEFAEVLSVARHAAIFEQVLLDKEQYRPVVASQLVDPQAQSMEFAALPSTVVQAATLLHVLVNDKQKNPVDASQSVVPHVHSALFLDIPLALTHAFDDVMVIVSSFQTLLPHAFITIGLGDNSGRNTSLVQ